MFLKSDGYRKDFEIEFEKLNLGFDFLSLILRFFL